MNEALILSVSRRTDIPGFYAEWFMNRLREGFAYVRNPFNPRHVYKITLDPTLVDCIVFWTKNPGPLLPHLKEIAERGYPFYFQFTLTPYDRTMEPNLPPKGILVDYFCELASKIGPERLIWRYDPILLSNEIDIEYHLVNFATLASQLQGSTTSCVISFLDSYAKTERATKHLNLFPIRREDMEVLGKELASLGAKYGLRLSTCSETIDLSPFGIEKGKCIDDQRIEAILGYSLRMKKDRNQRRECGCMESVDLGAYNTCPHGCLYCYANHKQGTVEANRENHDPQSPFLFGEVGDRDQIIVRKLDSLKVSVSEEE